MQNEKYRSQNQEELKEQAIYNVENNVMSTLILNDDFKKIKYDELNEEFYLLMIPKE